MGFINHWFLPPGIQQWLGRIRVCLSQTERKALRLSRPNRRFLNTHKGERVFILCNGPSVNEQNLLPLQNEVVISVSSGYLHKDYSLIKPRYHCTAPLPFSEKLTPQIAAEWLEQMDFRIGAAELFLSATDHAFVAQHSLFRTRKVNYLHICESMRENHQQIYDISGRVPLFQSVSVMALMIAMYMGFSTIYLLGTEHDSFRQGIYKHFYFDSKEYRNKDVMVQDDGGVKSIYDELLAALTIWQQYRILKETARAHSIEIFNATKGGALDVFERREFSSLFTRDLPPTGGFQ